MPRPSSREEVVAAAQDRFHRRGYHASGVKDITDAAGLPKGSFYNYFASKEDMAIETLRRYGSPASCTGSATRPFRRFNG